MSKYEVLASTVRATASDTEASELALVLEAQRGVRAGTGSYVVKLL